MPGRAIDGAVMRTWQLGVSIGGSRRSPRANASGSDGVATLRRVRRQLTASDITAIRAQRGRAVTGYFRIEIVIRTKSKVTA
jgi:hypothetical protein